MMAKTQHAFMISPPNNGAQCQTVVLTQDPSSGRYFHETVPNQMNASTPIFANQPPSSSAQINPNHQGQQNGGTFPMPPPSICPVSNVSPISSRQGACILTPSGLKMPAPSTDFCESWSETVPVLVKQENDGSHHRPFHCTQASVYEDQDDNYEKINYDYAHLPKVVSTSSLATQQAVQNQQPIANENPTADCSKMLNVVTSNANEQQAIHGLPQANLVSQANGSVQGIQQTSVPQVSSAGPILYPEVHNTVYGNMQQIPSDGFQHHPRYSIASSVGYQDMSRNVSVGNPPNHHPGGLRQQSQMQQSLPISAEFSSNYGRNSSLSGLDYDFNNPVYQPALSHTNSMTRNNTQSVITNGRLANTGAQSFQFSMQNLPLNGMNVENGFMNSTNTGVDRMLNAHNGYAYNEETAVAHF